MNRYALSLPDVTHVLLLNALGRTTLLLVLAWIATRSLRRLSAAQQHFLWLLALLGVVYVTGVSVVVSAYTAIVGKPSRASLSMPVWHAPNIKHSFVPTASSNATAPASFSAKRTLPPATTIQRRVGFAVTEHCAWFLMSLWLLGVAAMLFRQSRHRHAILRLHRHSVPLEHAGIQTLVAETSARLGVTRPPVLLKFLETKHAVSPLTWGWRRTYLLFPSDAATWQKERIEAVLLHELAHIQRRDWLTQRLADWVCAFYWFHPLVWLAAKQMKSCAERACDDTALTHGIAPTQYARQLLDMAQDLRAGFDARASHLETTLPFLGGLKLETRIRAILSQTASRRTFSRIGQHSGLAVGAICLMPLALALPVSTQTIKFVVSDKLTASNNKVSLPDGVTVELLGVSHLDLSRKSEIPSWWKPDGTPLAAPLYAPTVAQKTFRHGSLLKSVYTFSLKIGGITNTTGLAQAFIKNALMTGGAHNTLVPHDPMYTLYEVDVAFSKVPSSTSFRLKIAQGPWQTMATATTLPTTVQMSDGSSIRFGQPEKIEAGIVSSESRDKVSEAALVIRAVNNQSVPDMARRVVVIDDQGNTIPLDSSQQYSYTREQKGQEELHILLGIPETLRGRIHRYELQTRPYEYADFSNIALKPKNL